LLQTNPHVKNPYNSTFAYCSQGVQQIFTAPVYRAHCAVIFAIAQLSCSIIIFLLFSTTYGELVIKVVY